MGQTPPYQHVPAPKPQSSMMQPSSLHQMMMTQPTRINDQTMQMNLQGGGLSARQQQPLQPAPLMQPAPSVQQVGAPQMRPPMTQQYNQKFIDNSHHSLQQPPLSQGYAQAPTVNRPQSNTSFAGVRVNGGGRTTGKEKGVVGQQATLPTHQAHQANQGHQQGFSQRAVGQPAHHMQQSSLQMGHQGSMQQGMPQAHKAPMPMEQGHQNLQPGLGGQTLQQGHQGMVTHQGIQQAHQASPQDHQALPQNTVQQPQGVVGQPMYQHPQHTQHTQPQPQRPPQTYLAQQPQMIPAAVQHVVQQPQPIRPPSRQQRAYRTLRQDRDAEGKRLWTFASVVQVLSEIR